MKNYYRAVYLSLALLIMIVSGAINALFMKPNEWFVTLIKPEINGNLHSFFWLICYLLLSIIITEFFLVKKLQKRIFSIAVLLLGNALWCYTFFRLHNLILSVIIITVMLVTTFYILYLSVKYTRYLCLFALPVVVWYIVLSGLNIFILVVNAL